MRLLVAEDVAVSRTMLVSALRRMGHEVVATADGKEAWQVLCNEPIRLVIADWDMPEMDGIELVKRIRQAKNEYYTYVILLTAKSTQEDCITGLEAGADDYIVKPFDPQELMFRVRSGERVVRLEEELARRNEQLAELAMVDELTGIRNRRSFDESYAKLLAQAKRYGLQLGLAMIDIDQFKSYNDTFGHEAGDDVLATVASTLSANLRTADLVFRYGGEEFVCLWPMTGVRGARVVAERLRRAVESVGIPHPGNPPHGVVSISLGYACYDRESECVGDDLLRLADDALYRCKRNGRNRILASNEEIDENEAPAEAV